MVEDNFWYGNNKVFKDIDSSKLGQIRSTCDDINNREFPCSGLAAILEV